MKKYKLIKEYPGSPKLGSKLTTRGDDSFMKVGNINMIPSHYPEFWELVVEKEYEILSFSRNHILHDLYVHSENDKYVLRSKSTDNASGYYTWTLDTLLKSKDFRIHSIKRLSDGEVFTVGDKVNRTLVYKTPEVIKSFNLNNNQIVIKCTNGQVNSIATSVINKAKQPLFTTEDGVDIFESDNYYLVDPNFNVKAYKGVKDLLRPIDLKIIPRFSTKEAAEEYILMNKPCLSINDITELIFDCSYTRSQKVNEFKKLVKSKL